MISVIICTYKRAGSLKVLLESMLLQTKKPDEILIIDGSPDTETHQMLENQNFTLSLSYHKVPPEHRGLTKQRNFGVALLNPATQFVSFFDDDVVLESNYLELLLASFNSLPNCVGLSGISTNERQWQIWDPTKHIGAKWYILDGYAIKLADKNYLRRRLGLFTNVPPGFVPTFGHGYDLVPPSGKVYPAEHVMGCNMSYTIEVIKNIKFSEYFVGYGLYEDYDFSVRALRFGSVYVNTNLRLEHHHHPAGRPDTYRYGKMVTRNGWYVWRVRHPNPKPKDRFKWYVITILNTFLLLRFVNRNVTRMEFLGRFAGLFSLITKAPTIEY